MSALGNLLWFLCGGVFMALGWWITGVVMFCTIIGIPWARSCFVIGNLALFPFGHEAVNRRRVTGYDDMGTGSLGVLGNIVWFVVGGVWLAIGHVLWALACAATIIGIPFALQHLKLASLAMAPVSMTVVDIRGNRGE